jgi:hypothetical protein
MAAFDEAHHVACYRQLEECRRAARMRLAQAEAALRVPGGITPASVLAYARLFQEFTLAITRIFYLHVCRIHDGRTVVLAPPTDADISVPAHLGTLATRCQDAKEIVYHVAVHARNVTHSLAEAQIRIRDFVGLRGNRVFAEEAKRIEDSTRELALGDTQTEGEGEAEAPPQHEGH